MAVTTPYPYDDLKAHQLSLNLARYLRDASLSDLAHLTGALAAELMARSIPAAVSLGTVQARLEARAEMENAGGGVPQPSAPGGLTTGVQWR